jgi:thymidylate synthase
MRCSNAQEAFEYYYDLINKHGQVHSNTKALRNIGFYIDNPLERSIDTKFRKWKSSYAKIEWEWYLSQNRSVSELKKSAKIWDTMHNGDNIVNSNYGYQWNRNNQLDYIIQELIRDKNSRRAVLSIYDGKEHQDYKFDTPCTLSILFDISDDKLNMTVMMRSNDLWFGFCNDQYCFSKLQELVAIKLGIKVGWYYHFAANFHLYEQHLKK